MEKFGGAERRPGKGTEKDGFGCVTKRSRDLDQPALTIGGKWVHTMNVNERPCTSMSIRRWRPSRRPGKPASQMPTQKPLNLNKMTKQQLIEQVAAKTELKKSEAEVAVDSVLALIAEALRANERVDLRWTPSVGQNFGRP